MRQSRGPAWARQARAVGTINGAVANVAESSKGANKKAVGALVDITSEVCALELRG